MCTYSMMVDSQKPFWHEQEIKYNFFPQVEVTKTDFDDLKRKFEALEKAVEAAKHLDKTMGDEGCEAPEKIDLLPRIEKLLTRLERDLPRTSDTNLPDFKNVQP